MTIKDRDVIKQLDNYLNPDAVGLIDSYLEKNVHVEPILPNLTEGGCSHVPDAFFKEFDIITKGDMRSTLFDTDFAWLPRLFFLVLLIYVLTPKRGFFFSLSFI